MANPRSIYNPFARSTSIEGDQAYIGPPVLNGYNDGHVAGVKRHVLDLRQGGQLGWGHDPSYWISNHPYITRPVIPILLEPPIGFRRLPNSDMWIGTLRSIFETMAISITGLNAGVTLEVTDTFANASGEMHEAVTNSKMERTNISVEINEKHGMPVYFWLYGWQRLLIMDHETKYALINTIPGHEVADLLPDQYSCTVMFIEPDPGHRYVTQAWVVNHLFPHSTGANAAKRDKTNAQEKRDLTIEFGGIAVYGAGVFDAAQTILNNINIHGADPWARRSLYRDVSNYVKDVVGDGYERGVQKLSQENKITSPEARLS